MEPGASNDVDLSNYLSMVKRRWVPASIIFVSTLALSALVAAAIKPSYQAEGNLLFKNSSFKVAGSSLLPNGQEGEDAGDLKPLVATQNVSAFALTIQGTVTLMSIESILSCISALHGHQSLSSYDSESDPVY